jgi:hypothetical protein
MPPPPCHHRGIAVVLVGEAGIVVDDLVVRHRVTGGGGARAADHARLATSDEAVPIRAARLEPTHIDMHGMASYGFRNRTARAHRGQRACTVRPDSTG